MSDTFDRAVVPGTTAYVQWGPVIAGALCAAALATVLHVFGGAIGLAVSSTAATWRDASMGLWFLSGVYLILVALASYGLGGYVAGLLRERLHTAADPHDLEVRDNLHGLLVWAVATLLTALMLLLAASVARSPSVDIPGRSVIGENTIALEIDRLLRGERRAGDVDATQTRAETARILLTSSGHSGVAAEDRNYLVRLVGARTGLAGPEAERRVDAAIANAKESIARARRSTVILAFMAGAGSLLGVAAAWFAAAAGGQHRDDTTSGRGNVFGRRVVIRTRVIP